MLKGQKLYVVEYANASGEGVGIDWYADFVEATRQFNFAVENTEGPGCSVHMYGGYANPAAGQTTEDYVMDGHWACWDMLGTWKDPRIALTPEDETLYRNAASLMDSAEDVDPERSEYVRGMVELIMLATGKNSDDKEDIARTLAEFVQ